MLWSFWTSSTSSSDRHDNALLQTMVKLSQLLCVQIGLAKCSPGLSSPFAFSTSRGDMSSISFCTERFSVLSAMLKSVGNVHVIGPMGNDAIVTKNLSNKTLSFLTWQSNFVSKGMGEILFQISGACQPCSPRKC
ncbi:hypothetical protein PoB_004948400 [Plakobranchus ocellatus]|uniref:Uncharacterized protein n=1 Tax=Plakobranchus ocellatus TaxID=259542 RepID=A0AAV4BX39_9GAST|nr:hypothetical protein PoB_004948400 [Plakobranchus ocellatus]